METRRTLMTSIILTVVGIATVSGIVLVAPRFQPIANGVSISDVTYDCHSDQSGNVTQTLRFNLTSDDYRKLAVRVGYDGWSGWTDRVLEPFGRDHYAIRQSYPSPCIIIGAHIEETHQVP